ncbi:MAG: TonB-dependent receptor [Pseudomonadales bacterium]|nr:TonB-dependent receptor [Pseudomonadales bacterium]
MAVNLVMPSLCGAATLDVDLVEEIVVTGSRIQRANIDSPTPMTVLGRADIDGVGVTNIGELLAKLPSSYQTSGLSNSVFSATAPGLVTNALRNLGQSRTLTLVNGKRFVSGFNPGSGYAVDLSTLPSAMVDRIEVITGGASAVYGSDAIAGVVNVILKDDFDGVSFDVQTGLSAEGDRQETKIDLAMGTKLSKGNAWLTVGYSESDGVRSRDRKFSAADLIGADTNGNGFSDGLIFLGSSFTPAGRFGGTNDILGFFQGAPTGYNGDGSLFKGGVTLNGANVITQQVPGGEFASDRTNTDRYNRASLRSLLMPIQRQYFTSGINYDLTDDLTLDLMLGYNQTKTAGDFEPVALNINTAIFNTDVGATGGLDIASSLVMPELLKSSLLAAGFVNLTELGDNNATRRLVEFGRQGSRAARSTVHLAVDIDYQLSEQWNLSAYTTWGRTRTDLDSNGNINIERARLALDVELVDDVIQCVDAAARQAGCVPFNPFGEGTIDTAQVAYLSALTNLSSEVEQFVIGATFAGVTSMGLPGGQIRLASGFEFRKEQGSEQPSGFAQAGILSTNQIAATQGEFDVTEYYVEARLPVFEKLSIEAAFRLGRYSTVGDISTWKVGFEAQLFDWLKFRGTLSEAVRAPNITDLFAGLSDTFENVADACDGTTAATQGVTADNCRSVASIATRIEAAGSFTLSQIERQATGGVEGGDPRVNEEVADSYTLGASISIPYLRGLTMTLDWYDIEIDDAIAITGRSTVIERCYNVTSNFDSTCGGAALRNSVGALVAVNSFASNENQIETAGLDLDIKYALALTDLTSALDGELNINFLYTYIDEWEITGIVDGITDDNLGEVLFPAHRFLLTTRYSINDLQITWRARYWDDVKDSNTPECRCENSGLDFLGLGARNEIDDVFYHDLALSYALTEQVNLYFGARNVFDEAPPILAQGTQYGSRAGVNTAPEAYDVTGRRYYAGIRIDF